ncbi:MAG TPA: DUF4870 domain-containing protein [Dehalococcoidia bacterium]
MSTSGTTQSGLSPNVAGLLCYVLTFLTGLFFILTEKENKFVRFHALQAIFFGIADVVLWFVLTIIAIPLGFLGFFLTVIFWLGSLGLWIYLMYTAYQGQQFKLPVLGDLAEKNA